MNPELSAWPNDRVEELSLVIRTINDVLRYEGCNDGEPLAAGDCASGLDRGSFDSLELITFSLNRTIDRLRMEAR